ncbi:MAG: 2Fe-2S iron-sulfur cluster binding domain-containing protein [Pseudomonadota bacterium]|nr:2Fe-2S iron-sulfur cluster binding domain-containing protein [Pseudomonadota bacterium]
MSAIVQDNAASGGGYTAFRVVERTVESETITSFRLARCDGAALASFRPGQFLTLRLPGDLVRTYTISSSPDDRASYRITVKREPAPPHAPDTPPGRASNYLHDAVETGAVIDSLEPRGAFVLDEASARPVVLLSGGVGLTPMVSMAHRLAASGRASYFVHACENGRVHALRDEMSALAQSHPTLRTFFIYREPTSDDVAAGRFEHKGVVTREWLQRLLPLDDYDFYLCGPPGFMQAIYAALLSLGVAKARIKYEFFGPATVLEPQPSAPEQPLPKIERPRGSVGHVVFARSGKSAAWGDFKGTLLEFAELQGLTPEFSCRAGICNTCACDVLEGEVSYADEPLDAPAAGKALICLARPSSGLLWLDL